MYRLRGRCSQSGLASKVVLSPSADTVYGLFYDDGYEASEDGLKMVSSVRSDYEWRSKTRVRVDEFDEVWIAQCHGARHTEMYLH